jgi:hypothetical protein
VPCEVEVSLGCLIAGVVEGVGRAGLAALPVVDRVLLQCWVDLPEGAPGRGTLCVEDAAPFFGWFKSGVRMGLREAVRVAGRNLVPGLTRGGVRATIRHADDVLTNPDLLRGRSLDEVRSILEGSPGWEVRTLGRGLNRGTGWRLLKVTPEGNPTGAYIRYNPGGGHHGPGPYWRVSDGRTKTPEPIPAR